MIGFFIGLAAVTILVFFWAFRLIFGNFVEQAKEMGLPDGHPIFQFLAEQQTAMNLILLSTSVLMFIFLVVGGIILSHHIAGPLYRLRKHLERVIEGGETRDVSFRKKDFFQDLVPVVNAVVAKLRNAERK